MVRTGDDGPKGISCLVIEKDMAGVSFGAQEKKLGWHSQPTAQVNFDGVRVPAENWVGSGGEGFRNAMMGLAGGGRERKSVVEGKRWAVRLGLWCGRNVKQKNRNV